MDRLVLVLALGALVLIVGACARRFFSSEIAGFLPRLSAAFHGSATIVVARLTAMGAALLEVASNGADFVGAPGVRDAVQGLIPPAYWPMVLLGLAVTTELARRRTLPSANASSEGGAA